MSTAVFPKGPVDVAVKGSGVRPAPVIARNGKVEHHSLCACLVEKRFSAILAISKCQQGRKTRVAKSMTNYIPHKSEQ